MKSGVLDFARKYPDWHSYNQADTITWVHIMGLARRGLVEITDNKFRAKEAA